MYKKLLKFVLIGFGALLLLFASLFILLYVRAFIRNCSSKQAVMSPFQGTVEGAKQQVIAEIPITYQNNEEYQSSTFDTGTAIALSPNGRYLYHLDHRLSPEKSMIIDLETKKHEIIYEGQVDYFGWKEDNKLYFYRMSSEMINGFTENIVDPHVSYVYDPEIKSLSNEKIVFEDEFLTNRWIWTHDFRYYSTNPPKFYSPDRSSNFQLGQDISCFLDCNHTITSLDFTFDNGKSGKYILPKRINLNSIAIGESWTKYNEYILIENEFLPKKDELGYKISSKYNDRLYFRKSCSSVSIQKPYDFILRIKIISAE